LFPITNQGFDFIPHIYVRNKKDENLYPNTSACKRLATLMAEFEQGAASISKGTGLFYIQLQLLPLA
jgi:hypothetical protein